VGELPDDVRNNLPAMTFSFHVYSTNPQQRTIIINNRRMREGEEISAGVQLQEITEDGVILGYQQYRVHISVLSGW
jgi:general secretion pathway protein B